MKVFSDKELSSDQQLEPSDNPEIKQELPEAGAAAAKMMEDQDISYDTTVKDDDMSKEEELEPIVQMDKKGNLIFTCNICWTYKGSVDNTRQHQEDAHGEYAFACKNLLCTAAYKTKGGLNKYIKKHIEVTPTKCHNCQKVFQSDSEKCKHSCTKAR